MKMILRLWMRYPDIAMSSNNLSTLEKVNEIAYTIFKCPFLDLAEDLLRYTKCGLTPHYLSVVRRLFDCAGWVISKALLKCKNL
jgi:hypothetical protein